MSVTIPEKTAPAVQQGTVSLRILLAMLRWYRAAIVDPATEQEKAEWQRNSF